MQALDSLPSDALGTVLDQLVCLWKPSMVLPNLLKLPEPLLEVWLRGREIIDLTMSDMVPVAGLLKLIKKLPEYTNVSVLHLPKKVFESVGEAESVDVLNALDSVLARLPKLTVLGLHGIQLRTEHIPVLISIISALRDKLTGLSLSLHDWEFEGVADERFVLKSISKLCKLQMLVFPDWEEFVGDELSLVSALASARQCTVLVRGKLSQGCLSDVAKLAPNLTILSAPFEDTKVASKKRTLALGSSPPKRRRVLQEIEENRR
jgi:hypothetical protein